MPSTSVLENKRANRDVSDSRTESRQPFYRLVARHSREVPEVRWLTYLSLQHPRENVACLPLSFQITKRLLDVLIATLLLVVTAPVMLTAAVLIKLTSPGPVIYSQVRVGLNLRKKKQKDRRFARSGRMPDLEDRRKPRKDRRELRSFGRPFTIYKFRTMRNDAERHGAQFAQEGDSRITLVGRFLRRTRIDELPQLWNVLMGDMSMIGPRPERPEFMQELQQHIPNFMDRLGLKPGLTGIAQVVNGYDNELEGFRRKVSYDLMYLQNCCFWNELKILFRTIRVVITGEGAI